MRAGNPRPAANVSRVKYHVAIAALAFGLPVLAGCAWLDNSSRPNYDGPTQKALWHVTDVNVMGDPVVAGGVAYAIGMPWTPDYQATYALLRLYAVDLHAGRILWSIPTRHAAIVAVTGGTVYLGDTDGGGISLPLKGVAEAVDARTGHSQRLIVPTSALGVIEAGGVTYAAGPQRVVALGGDGLPRWSARLELTWVGSPVLSGSNVYVYGGHKDKYGLYDLYGAYAFDRVTGAPRWHVESRGKFPFQINALLADARNAYLWERLPAANGVDPRENDLAAVNAQSGHQVWKHQATAWCTNPPTLIEPAAIVACNSVSEGNTQYVALNRSNGSIVWQGTTHWAYDRYADYGRYMVVSDRKTHQVLDEGGNKSYDSWLTLVDRRSGNEVWRTPELDEADLTLPATADGIAVVGSKSFNFNDVKGPRDVAGFWAFALPTDQNR